MDNTLSYYDDNAKQLSVKYESADVDNIHNLLLDTFTVNSFLLEIGCGSGRDAAFMHQNKYDVYAVDGSNPMIVEAKNTHPELENRLSVMQIPDELDFSFSSFDGIYSIATLMHLNKESIERTIEKVSNILKFKGKFLFSVSIQRDDVNVEGKDKKGRQFTTLSEFEWISFCEKYGMKLKDSRVTNDGLSRDGIIWLTCIVSKDR